MMAAVQQQVINLVEELVGLDQSPKLSLNDYVCRNLNHHTDSVVESVTTFGTHCDKLPYLNPSSNCKK